MHHPIFEKISLEDVRLFAAVAEDLGFARAARRLRVPLSTVSRRVAALEESVGARLLQRTSRKVGLTADGARLLERTAPLLDELGAALESAVDDDEEPRGRLRVTAPVMSGAHPIAPALFAFAAKHPKVRLELVLTNAVVSMIDEGFDLGFRAGPIKDADLVARRLWSSPYALAASPSFVKSELGGRARVARARLAELPAITLREGGAFRLRRRDGTLDLVHATSRVTVNDPRVGLLAAAQGLGVVSAPRDAIASFGARLVELEVKGRTAEPRELFAIYPSRKLLPARVRLAVEWVAKHGVATPRAPV